MIQTFSSFIWVIIDFVKVVSSMRCEIKKKESGKKKKV